MVLHKVSPLLKSESNLLFFVPEVVSIGPYHHCCSDDNNQLAAMEPYKIKVSAQYGDEARKRVHKLLAEKERRPMYEGGPYAGMDRDAFADILFYDACFIIHFISTVGEDSVSRTSSQSREAPPPSVDMHLQGYVIRDLFLLENQLPCEVLKAVMPKGFENKLQTFICNISHDYNGADITKDASIVVSMSAAGRREPEHLLDMLHEKLVGGGGGGGGGNKHSGQRNGSWDSLRFRSVKELSEKGIKFLPSTTCSLTDVQYKEGYFRDTVTLPQMVVDDSTKSKFLNLMALEMCPGGIRRYDITSYICLLDNLIDHALDVRELRARGVLVNCLGSDQQVADLFNELATNRTPHPDAYVKIITGIHAHLKSRYKAHLATAYNTHFSTPWSMIATLAAALGLFFSAVQAWYSAKL